MNADGVNLTRSHFPLTQVWQSGRELLIVGATVPTAVKAKTYSAPPQRTAPGGPTQRQTKVTKPLEWFSRPGGSLAPFTGPEVSRCDPELPRLLGPPSWRQCLQFLNTSGDLLPSLSIILIADLFPRCFVDCVQF